MQFGIETVGGIGRRLLLKESIKQLKSPFCKNVLVFVSEDAGGSDCIRVVSPIMLNPRFQKTAVFCVREVRLASEGVPATISDSVLKRENVTFLIARNKISPSSLEAVIAIKERYGSRIVVDLDDDLFSIDETHPQFAEYRDDLSKLERLLNNSDLLIATTKEIVDSVNLRGVDVHSVVLPNYLDDRIWDVHSFSHDEKKSNVIRVLYSGTETHDDDLRMLVPVLQKVKAEVRAWGREIEFHVLGGTRLDLPGMIIHHVPDEARRYDNYVKWVQDTGSYDFALAPLNLNSKLNIAKSALKFLEYSAMSIPCVYSPIPAYVSVIENGVNGIIVDGNSLDGWVSSILLLACDSERRKTIGKAAEDDLKKNYLLSSHYSDWVDVLE